MTQLQRQDLRLQLQLLDLVSRVFGFVFASKRSYAHTRARSVFGVGYVGVGFETSFFEPESHFLDFDVFCKCTNLNYETGGLS